MPSLPAKMPNSKIFDAWALMAWVQDEKPAADYVRNCIERAEEGKINLLMSWINVGEVYYMLTRKHHKKASEDFLLRLPSLPIRLFLPNEEQFIQAAKLKASNKLSYADAFAVSLAINENAALVTGDPEIRVMAKGQFAVDRFEVDWIGPSTH